MQILVDVRLEPDYWQQVVRRAAKNGNEEEAKKILNDVTRACWDCLLEVSRLEEEYGLEDEEEE